MIIHTGLGRAVLCERAVEALMDVARGHSTLEIDVATGKRGSRQDHVASLLTELTGAEAALVVNNNAGAVFLAVNSLARDREVVISRGQLVEIGGSFRMPDIVRYAGARLVEVGTTNCTRIADYANAITGDTGLILRCHPSNFRIAGVSEETPIEELVALGRAREVPVLDDVGSGALVELGMVQGTITSPAGPDVGLSDASLEHEPTVQESVRTGADLVTFSGDKLLGASQAGVIVGRADLVALCRSNPLARALRIDKLTLAALEATLRVYRDGDPINDIPVLASIHRPLSDIERQAHKLARAINALALPDLTASVVSVESQTGGGSLPGRNL
ncbi:MAG: L-seryl-tRNA(Sec) selenium transferase, partial [Armatimonadota bacterium]